MAEAPDFTAMRSEFLAHVETSFKEGTTDSIKNKFNALKALNSHKRAALEQAVRDKLLLILSSREYTKELFEKFITLCISLCRQEMVAPVLSVVLLGDIFDATTLDICQSLFEFVEKNVATWKEELFFSTCKNNILRMCNDLLRRLSKSQNTIFCGRILLFLAMFFPFSERSGLNIVSEFNLDNVTKYGADSSQEDMENNTMEEIVPESSIKIDYNFYVKFWSLQDFFRSPNQCYNKVQWKEFINHSNAVLSVFKNYKVEADPTEIVISKTEGQHYFAKFLTNQKLLVLQLNDVNFRRTIYLQFLILFQFLNAHVKSKPESFELKPDQADWVKETTQLIHKLIRETPPDGEKFMEAVLKILEREEHWNNWKNEGCPALKPVSSKTEETLTRPTFEKNIPFGEVLRNDKNTNKFFELRKDGTKLWHMNNAGELQKCEKRQYVPSLKSFFEEVVQQADPAAMIEPKYKKVNDITFSWSALRLLRERSPHFYAIAHNPIPKLPDFIEDMCKKISKEPYYSETGRKYRKSANIRDDVPDTLEIFKLPEGILNEETKKVVEVPEEKVKEEKKVIVEIEDDVEVDVGPGADSDSETKDSKEPGDEEEVVDEEEEEEDLDEEEEVDEEVEEEEEEEIEDEDDDEEEEGEEGEIEGGTKNEEESSHKPKAKKEKLCDEPDADESQENCRKKLKTSHDTSGEEPTIAVQTSEKKETIVEPSEKPSEEKPAETEIKDTPTETVDLSTDKSEEQKTQTLPEHVLLEEEYKVLETADDSEVIEIDLEKVQDQSLIKKIMGDEILEEEKKLLGENEGEKKEESKVTEGKHKEVKVVEKVQERNGTTEEKDVKEEVENPVPKEKKKTSPEKRYKLSDKQLEQIVKALGSSWPKLFEKLGYKGSEIKKLASRGHTSEKCKLMLEKWLKKSDTSTEKLHKYLKSLGFDSAARVIS